MRRPWGEGRLAAAALLVVVLGGCALESPNLRPAPALPPAFATPDAAGTAAAGASPTDWWALFGDPELSALLAQAERESPDLQAAVARLAAAGDALAAARAARWPSLSLFAAPIDPAASQAVRNLDGQAEIPLYEIGLRAQYEIDLWGRVRNGVLAAAATRDAGDEDLAAARIALRSAVAIAYFDIRQTDALLQIEDGREPLERQRLALLELRRQAGRASADTLAEARLAIDEAAARRSALARARASAVDALAVLIGVVPETFSLPPLPLAALALPPLPPAGLPSTLLERRPDLRAAEARLAAAEAQAAVARAERMPQIGLTAELGVASGPLRRLVGGARGFGGAGPVIDVPLFDGGRRSAQAAAAEHLADAEAAAYRKAVLTALAEVERALRAQTDAADQAALAESTLVELESQRQRAQQLLDAGRITRFETLALEQRRFEAQAARLRALRARQDSVIALYQALGGGWTATSTASGSAQANR